MTLIYGVKSVSAQSEYAIKLLADLVREEFPQVSTLLEDGRYVDDQGESKSTKEECYELIEQSNKSLWLDSRPSSGLFLGKFRLTLFLKMEQVWM